MLHNRHVSVLMRQADQSIIRVEITDRLSCILVVLGIVGNLLGLCIFSSSRRTRQLSSVYVYLATSSSIINLCCVIRYSLILHSKPLNIISDLVGHNWSVCKIYELSFGCRVISSWITLFWMFERVTCISKRLRNIFYRWNASRMKFIIPLIIVLIILLFVLGPPVYMFKPQKRNSEGQELFLNTSTKNVDNFYCGIGSELSIEWQKYFDDIHLGLNHYTIRCIFSELIPTLIIILFDSCIIYYVIHKFRRLNEKSLKKMTRRQKRKTSWMNIILFLHSLLFFLSLLSHIAGHFMSVEAHETWWVSLVILLNSSLNFYVYCLSSKAFRQQTCHVIRRLTINKLRKFHIYKYRK